MIKADLFYNRSIDELSVSSGYVLSVREMIRESKINPLSEEYKI